MKLKPGSELDELVASEVMGLKIFHAKEKKTAMVFGCKVAHGTWIKSGLTTDRGPICVPVRKYSTDISAAWDVVRKMQTRTGRKRGALSLEAQYKSDGKTVLWAAQFGVSRIVNANTEELAICLAALAAMEQK